MKKRICAIVLALVLALCAAGCTGSIKEQAFTKSGMSITLTSAFTEAEYENYTVCYDSKDVAVFALKESFEDLGVSDLPVEEYAKVVIEANNSNEEIVSEDGLVYFVFEASLDEGDYTYLACMYKGSDAYWLVQFACETENYETLKPQLIKYAQSVTV